MQKQYLLALAAVALSAVAFGQIRQDGDYQIGYAANLNIGDSVLNLSNDGINGAFYGATPATVGNICVNVYTFDATEEEISCCACLVTPNGLNSLSAQKNLILNTLTPAVPTSIVIKLLGSTPGTSGTTAVPVYNVCNPATAGTTTALAATSGMLAWGTTVEAGPTAGTYSTVSVAYLGGGLSGGELAALSTICGFIQSDGTGYGICPTCNTGALSGVKK